MHNCLNVPDPKKKKKSIMKVKFYRDFMVSAQIEGSDEVDIILLNLVSAMVRELHIMFDNDQPYSPKYDPLGATVLFL